MALTKTKVTYHAKNRVFRLLDTQTRQKAIYLGLLGPVYSELLVIFFDLITTGMLYLTSTSTKFLRIQA